MLCVHCTIRAVVNWEPVTEFNESPSEHLARWHSDPVATEIERQELEKKLDAFFEHIPLPQGARTILEELQQPWTLPHEQRETLQQKPSDTPLTPPAVEKKEERQ